MKRLLCALLCVLLLVAAAQTIAEKEKNAMRIYVADGALDKGTALRLAALLGEAFPQTAWEAVFEAPGVDLRSLIMADKAPELAICAPSEARPWAREGLTLALEGKVEDLSRMQRQVVDACVWEEKLFMAPLRASHRQMAVNRRMLEAQHMGYMLDQVEYPVWYPTQINQILEEFAMAELPGLEIWPAEPENSAALEALVQAIYGGMFLEEDGTVCKEKDGDALLGLVWLRDLVSSGMIGMAKDRQTALDNFVAGKTAMFADWTQAEQTAYGDQLEANGVELVTAPYPSATGMPVRSYELYGIAAFAGEHGELALEALSFICADAQAQIVLGSRGIWQDNAIWLPCMEAAEGGTTLRRLFCDAVNAMLEGAKTPDGALSALLDTMQTLP